MKIRYIQLKDFQNLKLIKDGKKSIVCRGINKESGSIFKFFKLQGSDLKNMEKKIIAAKTYKLVPEICVPTYAIYLEDGTFWGYQMEEIKGCSFRKYIVDSNPSCNLYTYADAFSDLEDIVERGHKREYVFPDLATLSNIIVSRDSGQKFLIDYDGMQVSHFPSTSFSYGLNLSLFDLDKYYKDKKKRLFSPNLDFASLLHMYFRNVFHIDLCFVGKKSQITGNVYTLDDIFSAIGLTHYDFMGKVSCLFSPDMENQRVGNLFYEIAETYKLKTYKKGNMEFRSLVKR